MTDCKQQAVPVLHGTKLSVNDSPKTYDKIEEMKRVPYASVFGSLMYVMVSTRHCTSSGSIKSFYGESGQVTWGCYEKSSGIFEGYVIVCVLLSR